MRSCNIVYLVLARWLLSSYCLVGLLSLCGAAEITVGSKRFSIPTPPGYAEITSDVGPYYRVASGYVAPGNTQLALFLPLHEVALANAGSIPRALRGYSIQVQDAVASSDISSAQFAAVKQATKAQLQELVKKAAEEAPEKSKRVREQIGDNSSVSLKALTSVEMASSPPHYESSLCLAWTTQVRRTLQENGEIVSTSDYVITAALIHVRNKLLTVNVWAEREERDWTRAASTDWAQKIIIANLHPSTTDKQEGHLRDDSSGKWVSILARVLGTALLVLLIGALRHAFRQKPG